MPSITRRQALAMTIAAGFLAATRQSTAATLKTVSVALDWTPNTNHIGLYVAREKGFYAEAGLDVAILPYSDTSAGTLVSNRAADFGIVGAIGLFTQKTAGADLKGVYAVVQTETGRLVFNPDLKSIASPKDLDGLTYGGFGSDWETRLIETIIRHDGGKGEFRTVTLGTSAYEALANGAVDFTLEVATWEGVKADLMGHRQGAFRYADFGVPDQHTTFIASSSAYLSENPDTAAAFAKATRRGYAFSIDHPDEAAQILIDANSDMLSDPDLIRASLKALIDGHYLRSADGAIGTIDPAKMSAIGDYLVANKILRDADGAVLVTKPDYVDYYTNALLTQK